MRRAQAVLLPLLLAVTLSHPAPAIADDESATGTMPVSQNQLIKITDHGLVPNTLDMNLIAIRRNAAEVQAR